MRIISAKFIKGIVGRDKILEDGRPKIAFIGRSNVGKSGTINSLVKQKDLVMVSFFPGRTRQINIFLINESFYLVDLPGYGYSRGSKKDQWQLYDLVNWYLFFSGYEQKWVVLIMDANIGITDSDLEILRALEEHKKNIIIAANKIDKIKKTAYGGQMQKIQEMAGNHKVIPYSAKKEIGIENLSKEIFGGLK